MGNDNAYDLGNYDSLFLQYFFLRSSTTSNMIIGTTALYKPAMFKNLVGGLTEGGRVARALASGPSGAQK